MTISILSDLHCHRGDHGEFPPSFDEKTLQPADVLVFAGDLATRDTRDFFCDRLKKVAEEKFKNVIVVYGNHDYYTTKHMFNDIIKPDVKDNFVTSITEKSDDGKTDRVVDFVCSTLWSPILKNDLAVEFSINDYSYIPEFTAKRSTELFFDNLEWLEKQVAESKKAGHTVVVVTHHLPRKELIDEHFKNSEVNEAFCVLNDEAEKRLSALSPVLWIHGHSHNFMDKTIDNIRYIRNPFGYEYGFRREITGYKHNLIVDI